MWIKYVEGVLISLIAVFAPIQATVITVLVMVFADLFTGIWAAVRRGEKITSSGLRRSISKLVVYELALALGYVAEIYLFYSALPVAKIVAGLIGATELRSVIENSDSILGESTFQVLLDKLGSKHEKEPKSNG